MRTATSATSTRIAPHAAAARARRPDRLRRALAEGTIDAVCSDHTPVDDDAKQVPFAEAEPGATGLELLLPLTLKWGSEVGLTPLQALGAVTHRAARVLGVRAGTLEVGAAADVCLYDARKPWVVQSAALASQGKNTPFQGLELVGRVVRTIVGGRPVHLAQENNDIAHSSPLERSMTNPLLDFSALPRFSSVRRSMSGRPSRSWSPQGARRSSAIAHARCKAGVGDLRRPLDAANEKLAAASGRR